MRFIPYIQAALAIIVVILILLQERSAGLGGLLGGSDGGSTYQTRRGMERSIFIATIVFAILFAGLAVAQLVL